MPGPGRRRRTDLLGVGAADSVAQYLTLCRVRRDTSAVIRSFRHAGLRQLFETGKTARVRPDLQRRALTRLKVLDEAVRLTDLNVPGFNFHKLLGKPVRDSLHVNGPWCVTFEWKDGEAVRVNLEQYH